MIQAPLVPPDGGAFNALNLTAATVVKASPGRVFTVVVNTAGTTAGGIYDAATTAGNTAANLIANIEAAGVYELSFPCLTGILFTPGTGMVASVAYS